MPKNKLEVEQIDQIFNALSNSDKRFNVTIYEKRFIISLLQARMGVNKFGQFNDYFSFFKCNDEEQQLVKGLIQNNYSLFFRNSLTFTVLEHVVIPSIIQYACQGNRKEIRIWSSACAIGQEPYSLAILFAEALRKIDVDLVFRIFATDKNGLNLEAARVGHYSYADVQNVTLNRLNSWFTQKGDTYMICDELKRNIDFSVYDILDSDYSCPPASIFGDFDLVMGANLLFYYEPDIQRIMIDKLTKSMNLSGFFVTGEVERDMVLKHKNEVYPFSAIFK